MIRMLLAAAALAMFGSVDAQAPPVAEIIHAGRLLADAATGRVETERSVLIGADGRIQAIERGYVTRGAAEIIDLRSMFVLPGLIDSHVHLRGELGADSRLDPVIRSEADVAFVAAHNARLDLAAGFTTVADLGSPRPEAIFALRDAIVAGTEPGPRIVAAGRMISAHGGHGDVAGFNEEVLQALAAPSVCSGADDCARAVRQMVQRGADIIKFAATGGVLSNTAAGLGQQLTDAEMRAIVETAHSMGRRVTAHAHSAGGINAALRAGVDSIEHGTYLDDESIRLLKRDGVYLVPTVIAGVTAAEVATRGGVMTPAQTAKALEVGDQGRTMIRQARQGGVRIAFGTDTGVSPHGENARELDLLAEAGYTPLEIIGFATVAAADHLGISAVTGKIAPGLFADIIAVAGDPTADVAVLHEVPFVMARGRVFTGP